MKHALAVSLLLAAVGCGITSPPRSPERGGGAGGDVGGAGGDSTGGAAGKGGPGGTGGSLTGDAAARAPDAGGDAVPGIAADVAAAADVGAGVVPDAAAAEAAPPLAACAQPSVDHLEMWRAHGGSLRPAVGGNLLVKEGDRHYAKVEFLPGSAWHEIVVPVANSLSKKADLGASRGITITYSATAELWVQLRPLSHPHGGEQHTAKLPATGGVVTETFMPFTAETWGTNLLGKPTFPFADALKDANFFNFVGPPSSANVFIVKGLRFDGYVPSCS